ncbi:hypothetical protein [Gulosibacter bifidus]|uniref:Cation-transporting P-type ATPase C-terminal domain-containing protein n=1 Tax=Gulosibacter bifidus TaxID=272239 RepID=A0ABW5RM55_9MICO|nr:hypothetical protein [Gulosibacter bifidus]
MNQPVNYTSNLKSLLDTLTLVGTFGLFQFTWLALLGQAPLGWLLAFFARSGVVLVPALSLIATYKVPKTRPLFRYFAMPISLYAAGVLSTTIIFPPVDFAKLYAEFFKPLDDLDQPFGIWGLSALVFWVGRLLFFENRRPTNTRSTN